MYADIQGNAEQFARSLDALGKQIQEDVFDKVIKKALFDLLKEIIRTTPVDTGRAMGSWTIDVDWKSWQLPPGDYNGEVVAATVAALPDSDRYVIYNNLEYIQALESGHSKQRPSGFVAQALAAIGGHVARAARAAGYEGTI